MLFKRDSAKVKKALNNFHIECCFEFERLLRLLILEKMNFDASTTASTEALAVIINLINGLYDSILIICIRWCHLPIQPCFELD